MIHNINKIKYSAQDENINPLKEPLTVEKVKTFEGFENVSDEEALDIVSTIDSLCRIVYEYLCNLNKRPSNNLQNIAA